MDAEMILSEINREAEKAKPFLNNKVIGKTFEVTQQDIQRGLRCSSTLCPISLGMDRCFVNANYVFVYKLGTTLDFTKHNGKDTENIHIHITHSENIVDWISSFDDKKEVKPINVRVIKSDDETKGELVLA